jgi:hypothetical protein
MVAIIPVAIILVIVLIVLARGAKTSVKIRAMYIKTKDKVMFNAFLRGFITCYVGFCVTVYSFDEFGPE